MLTNKFFWVGLRVIFLAYTVQSIVILKPNKKELKKLARKFVIDKLANEMVDFWIQAAGQMSINDTKIKLRDRENNKNINTETTIKIPFKRLTSWQQDTSESLENSIEYTSHKTTSKYKSNSQYETHNENMGHTQLSFYQPMKIQFILREKTSEVTKEKSAKETQDTINKTKVKLKQGTVIHMPTFNGTAKSIDLRYPKSMAKSDKEEDKNVDKRSSETVKPVIRGFNIDNADWTTKKQKLEFDHYNNPNFRAGEMESFMESAEAHTNTDENYFSSEEVKKFWL